MLWRCCSSGTLGFDWGLCPSVPVRSLRCILETGDLVSFRGEVIGEDLTFCLSEETCGIVNEKLSRG